MYLALFRRHWIVSALVAITFASLLAQSFWFGKMPQRRAYLAAVVISAMLVDAICFRKKHPPQPVRRPGLELLIAAVSFGPALGLCFAPHPERYSINDPSLLQFLRPSEFLTAFSSHLAFIPLVALNCGNEISQHQSLSQGFTGVGCCWPCACGVCLGPR
jgi:hypothetical protein